MGGVPAIEGGAPVRSETLPFFRVSIDERDISAVTETLRSGWLTVGPRTEELEARLREYFGVSHALTVSSCSEAMLLSLKALDIGPGDEVITSALTFASTVHAIVHTGAHPVLADIETETFGPDPDSISSKVTSRTRAVMPVHFGGQACRIQEICESAKEQGHYVVEDAAHSFGAFAGGTPVGRFGDATTFSFYVTKNLTTGEGGAITTMDDDLATRLRLLSYHGMSRDSWKRYTDKGSWYYEVEVSGFKANMSDMQASLGLSQLDRLDEMLERRRAIAGRFRSKLDGSRYFELPRERTGNVHTWHLFVLRIVPAALRIGRDEFIRALTAENIGSSVHFIPIYRHPFFEKYGASPDEFPATEDYFSRCISLPVFPSMTDSDVDDVVEALSRIADYYRTG